MQLIRLFRERVQRMPLFRPKRFQITGVLSLWLVLLLLLHSLFVGNVTDYTYLIWNFFLALLPLFVIFSGRIVNIFHGKIVRYIISAIIAILWLLLLPNTFYLLTEFTHLNSAVLVNLPGNHAFGYINYTRGSALYVFDSLLMLVSALFGGYTGAVALLDAFHFFKRQLSHTYSTLIVTFIGLLSIIGVYIGRYGRWNSWDAITQPLTISHDIFIQLSHAVVTPQFLLFIISIGLFEVASLYVVARLKIYN